MEEQEINLKELLEELQNDMLNNDIIQDNKIHFSIGQDIYRVRMPNQKDLLLANSIKYNKFIELVGQKDTATINQLTKALKDKGIDVEKMNEECNKIEEEMKDVYLTLAKKKDGEKKAIEELKKKLSDFREKRMNIILEKTELLSSAIENQANDYYYKCLASLCTEKYEEHIVSENEKMGIWKNVWASFEEFKNDSSKLSYIAIGKLTELIYSI